MAPKSSEPPHKRPRLAQNTMKEGTTQAKAKGRTFASAQEIRAAFREAREGGYDAQVAVLTALRNQLSPRPDEPRIAPHDARLLLAQAWMESGPGAQEVFDIWDAEGTSSRRPPLLAPLLTLLASLLTLLTAHYPSHALGLPVARALLTPINLRKLNAYLGAGNNDLILVTLKLFGVLSDYGGGAERGRVLEGFAWESKALPKVLNMRRKGTNQGSAPDPLLRPDIRTLYLLLLLSLLSPSSSSPTSSSTSAIKTTLLTQHLPALLAAFKGLPQDPAPVVRRVLEVMWAGVWSDARVKRSVKVAMFGEGTVGHLLKLYERTSLESDTDEHAPADLAHHFLLAICTRPAVGICFRDRGWYPREADTDADKGKGKDNDDADERGRGRIYNKILANVLKTLKVNEDARQQELALRIMEACPELVAGYWSAAALTLEPRLSSKWIANIAFFGRVLSLPVPTSSFLLPTSTSISSSTLYNPTPPPLSTILSNILPSSASPNLKSALSKGLLLTSSGLVQHLTALALIKCLSKYERVLEVLTEVAEALGENDAEGQWNKRRNEVEREVRRRMPDLMVVLAFGQQATAAAAGGNGKAVVAGDAAMDSVATPKPENPTRAALLGESAQRLLLMYHRVLPAVVAEARFDVGKMLAGLEKGRDLNEQEEDGEDGEKESDAGMRLDRVKQLHVLKMLKESDQFVWTGKSGSSPHTYLHTLLLSLATPPTPATHRALKSLLAHLLAQSILFQEDPTEPELWLAALPRTRRTRGAEAPDGTPLTGESESVADFLDDCIQRCIKTPYRYIEELYALVESGLQPATDQAERLDMYPSPLLMTVLEQLSAKRKHKTLSASDVLALAAFIRKLVMLLAGKLHDLALLRVFVGKIDAVLAEEELFAGYPLVSAAIRREVRMMYECLEYRLPSDLAKDVFESSVVKDFLDQVEQVPVPPTKVAQEIAAYELADWLRLVDQPLNPVDIQRLSAVVQKFHAPAIEDIVQNLDPAQGLLWDGINVVSRFTELRRWLSFPWLFLSSGESHIVDEQCRSVLIQTLFTDTLSLLDVKRAIHHVSHALAVSQGRGQVTTALLLLLSSIFEFAADVLPSAALDSLKEDLFVRKGIVKDMMMEETLSSNFREGLSRLVSVSLNPLKEGDRKLAVDVSNHYLSALRNSLGMDTVPEVPSAALWIKYLSPLDLFSLMDTACISADSIPSQPVLDLLKTILAAVALLTTSEAETEASLLQRLPNLLALRPLLHDFAILEDMIAVGVEASLPVCCNGSPVRARGFENSSIIPVLRRAEMRWARTSDLLPATLQLQQFLEQDKWTSSTVKIISGLLYRRLFSKEAFHSWLSSDSCAKRVEEHLIPIFHAFLDTSKYDRDVSDYDPSLWMQHLSRMTRVVMEVGNPTELRTAASSCISLLLTSPSLSVSTFIDLVVSDINAMPVTAFTAEAVSIGTRLHSHSQFNAKPLVVALVDRGVQWAIRQLSDDAQSSDTAAVVDKLMSLVKLVSYCKAHFAETLLGVVIQQRLSDVHALKLATAVSAAVALKPLVVNRYLQSIAQHPYFFKICAVTDQAASSPRDAAITLLHTLFNLHPTNTCQATHIEPLVRIYGGTLSSADLKILSIFQLFEGQRKTSVASLLSKWSTTPSMPSTTSLDAIQSLNPIVVLRTCLNFPTWRQLEDQYDHETSAADALLYDPIFLMLLFSQVLAEKPPASAFAWVELFRTNIISLFIRALSSRDGQVRDIALCQIAALWKYIEFADLQEKPHIVRILTLLKNTLPPPLNEGTPLRLPSYTTLILSHALRGIFYPSNFIYPLTARFLLQRPELDTSDVPMLYGMLYSNSDDWKKERGWIIRFLSDGMVSSEDWRVFKRRYTWDLLASLFESSETDHTLRNGVLEVLANLTCNAQAATSLALKSAVLTWIEMQIRQSTMERTEWVKILENLMVFANSEKLESSTNGEWRAAICRCVCLILSGADSVALFPLTVPIILRLAWLPGKPVAGILALLDRAMDCLLNLEAIIHLPQSGEKFPSAKQSIPAAPHRVHSVHEPFQAGESLAVWGTSVEMLWQAAMSVQDKAACWDSLTSRLLVWRAVAEGEECPVGEWARAETVRSLS